MLGALLGRSSPATTWSSARRPASRPRRAPARRLAARPARAHLDSRWSASAPITWTCGWSRRSTTPRWRRPSPPSKGRDAGRARYVGVSNYSGWQTARADAARRRAAGRDPGGVLVGSGTSSARSRLLPRPRLGLLPWSPLGRGVLTGKYRDGVPADSRAASPHFERFVAPYLDDRCPASSRRSPPPPAASACPPLEVALASARDRPGVVAPVLGARTVGQLLGALQTEEIELPREIRAALDDVSA